MKKNKFNKRIKKDCVGNIGGTIKARVSIQIGDTVYYFEKPVKDGLNQDLVNAAYGELKEKLWNYINE